VLVLVLAAVTILTGCTPAGSAAPSGTAGTLGTAAPSGTARPGSPAPDTGGSRTGADGAPSAFPPADVAAIRAAIDQINATAGGPVAIQRAELDRLVVPDQAARQRSCPPASGTIRFEPAYPSLRRPAVTTGQADGATGASPAGSADRSPAGSASGPSGRSAGEPSEPGTDSPGMEYLLPAFITIYTGGRITGNDLTTLHLWVEDGMARTPALCVS
jgi:hypothetical protein